MKPGTKVDCAIAAIVLPACLCQVGIGARFSDAGEQIGLALPVSTVVLAVAICLTVVRHRPRGVPFITLGQAAFLSLVWVGLLGMTRSTFPSAVKELVQLGETIVASALLFRLLVRRGSAEGVQIAFALGCALALCLGGTGLAGARGIGLSSTKLAAFVVMSWPFLVLSIANLSSVASGAALLAAGGLVGVCFQSGLMLIVWAVVALASLRWLKGRYRGEGVACIALALILSAAPLLHEKSPWNALQPRFGDGHDKRLVIEAKAALRAPRYLPLGGGLGRYRSAINYLKQYGSDVPHPEDERVPRDGNCQYLVTLVEAGLPAAVALVAMLIGGALIPAMYRDSSAAADPVSWAASASLLAAAACAMFCVLLSRGTGIWVGALLGLSACHDRIPGTGTRLRRLAIPFAAVWLGTAALLASGDGAALDPVVSHANVKMRELLFRETEGGVGRDTVLILDDPIDSFGDIALQVEAEACASRTKPFIVIPANDASGDHALAVPHKSGKSKGSASYAVDVPEDGSYLLFARVHWKDGCANSVRFQAGGETTTFASEIFRRWHVLTAKRAIRLEAGSLEVVAHNLEDGVWIDYWGLRRAE